MSNNNQSVAKPPFQKRDIVRLKEGKLGYPTKAHRGSRLRGLCNLYIVKMVHYDKIKGWLLELEDTPEDYRYDASMFELSTAPVTDG